MTYFGTRLSENISRREPEGYLICLNVPVARTGTQEWAPSGSLGYSFQHRLYNIFIRYLDLHFVAVFQHDEVTAIFYRPDLCFCRVCVLPGKIVTDIMQ